MSAALQIALTIAMFFALISAALLVIVIGKKGDHISFLKGFIAFLLSIAIILSNVLF